MPVFIRVGGKRVSAACCSLVRFLQNTASCAHQLFFHRVLHNANIFDINGLLSSWAIPESHLHLPRPVKGYHDGAVVSGFFVFGTRMVCRVSADISKFMRTKR